MLAHTVNNVNVSKCIQMHNCQWMSHVSIKFILKWFVVRSIRWKIVFFAFSYLIKKRQEEMQ